MIEFFWTIEIESQSYGINQLKIWNDSEEVSVNFNDKHFSCNSIAQIIFQVTHKIKKLKFQNEFEEENFQLNFRVRDENVKKVLVK